MSTDAARRLQIQHPILQGPFGGGLSSTKLVAAVSNKGGLGGFGAYQNTPDEIAKIAAEIRTLTSNPFNLNLWVSTHDPEAENFSREDFDRTYRALEPLFRELGAEKPEPPKAYYQNFDQQVEAILEIRPPVFSFVFGIPEKKILEECRRRSITTVGAATTIAEAKLAAEAGVDLLVVTGFEAGGHRPSFLAPAEDSLHGTLALTRAVAARTNIPLISAGGIADRAGVEAVLKLGAQAAQLGTVFLACEESGATPEHRALLFSERAERTQLTRAFTGRLARGIRNRFVEEIAPQLSERAPFPVQSWFVSKLRAEAVKAKRTDLVALWCGQGAPVIKYHSAAEVMDALT